MEWLILQITSCAMMTGLIWTIQVLHYPTFTYVSENQFQKFHGFHTKNISLIVLPMMTLELVTALALVIFNPDSLILCVNFFLLILIWLCTFFVSVRFHNVLVKGKNIKTLDRLILMNWFRTLLWSARLCLLLYVFLSAFEGNSLNLS